jgi:hypothetical protein
MAHFKYLLFRHLPGGTEENTKNMLRYPVFGPRFERRTSRIRSRSACFDIWSLNEELATALDSYARAETYTSRVGRASNH